TLYPLVTSRLTSIRDMPPASAETSTSLISLKPRIAEVQLLQDTQAREIAELQKASAALLERWYEVTVLGSGECWADWDKRRNDIDRGLRRLELSATKDDV
ncbi:MAG: hypothetical protein M1817_000864, partial [Caeruleum heppii]